jgi:hypothetical protein
VRPDGQQVSWRTATPLRFDLPFLIDDLTPRQLRVPGGTSSRHANQLISIDGVFMVVIDLYNSRLGYSHLLALEPDREAPSGETGIVSETIRIGSSHINLVDLNSLQNAGPLRRYIGTRPGRPYALQLRNDQGESHYLVRDPVRGYELSASTPEVLTAW